MIMIMIMIMIIITLTYIFIIIIITIIITIIIMILIILIIHNVYHMIIVWSDDDFNNLHLISSPTVKRTTSIHMSSTPQLCVHGLY